MRQASLVFCGLSACALLAACGQDAAKTADVETLALSHLMVDPGHGGGHRPGDPNGGGYDPNRAADPNWGHDPNHAGDPNMGGGFPGSQQPGQGGNPNDPNRGQGGGYPGSHHPGQGGNPNDPNRGQGGGYPGSQQPGHAGNPNDPNGGGQAWPPQDPNHVGDGNRPSWPGGGRGGHGGQGGQGGQNSSQAGGQNLTGQCAAIVAELVATEHALIAQPEFDALRAGADWQRARATRAQAHDEAVREDATHLGLMATPEWSAYMSQYETAVANDCLP